VKFTVMSPGGLFHSHSMQQSNIVR